MEISIHYGICKGDFDKAAEEEFRSDLSQTVGMVFDRVGVPLLDFWALRA
jgi:hypothetical protein